MNCPECGSWKTKCFVRTDGADHFFSYGHGYTLYCENCGFQKNESVLFDTDLYDVITEHPIGTVTKCPFCREKDSVHKETPEELYNKIS